ncbi:hypothetical protein AB0M36_09570 [Actinoplanes sp. NPDC051346]|uniref:hypothetical protein n=1 Tax=Actinoplanes sp. NPDC051346 TaxID=3155048 RepID=UPI0034442C22
MTGLALIGGLLTGPAAPAGATGPATLVRAAAAAPVAAKADDACGRPIVLGTPVTCPELEASARHTFTVTTASDGERLAVRVLSPDRRVRAELADADENASFCQPRFLVAECVVPKAGEHTLVVIGAAQATDYVLAVDSRTNPSRCADLPAAAFAVSAPGRDDALPAGSVGTCYRFDQPAGAVVRIDPKPAGAGAFLQGEVRNAEGDEVCDAKKLRECVLRGSGPYRLFLVEIDGEKVDYHLTTTRMSEPTGCRESSLAAFGGPGDRAVSATVADGRPVCFTFAASAGPHLVVSDTASLFRQVFDSAGKEVTCTPVKLGHRCVFSSDGTYTLIVSDSATTKSRDVQLAMYPLAGTQGCSSKLGSVTKTRLELVRMQSPLQVDCHLIEADQGDLVQAFTVGNGWLTNATGAPICGIEPRRGSVGVDASAPASCPLKGAGPYRAIVAGSWDEKAARGAYSLHFKLVRDAEGCAPVRPGRYGESPAGDLSDDSCRLLVVPAAGRYRVELVDGSNRRGAGTVTDSQGTRVCETGWCTFPAAGRYRLTAVKSDSYATVFLPEPGGPDTGCAPASDEPQSAAQNVEVRAGGIACLTLSTPAGARLRVVRPTDTATTRTVELSVQDAAGNAVCDLPTLSEQGCVLQGTAPFRAFLNRRAGTDQDVVYPLTFVRLGGNPTCPVLPAESSAASDRQAVSFDSGHYVRCFSVPASAHSAAEVVSIRKTDFLARARVSVVDENGELICRTTGAGDDDFTLCRFGAGAATVLVESPVAAGSYALSRRDVAGTAANCRELRPTSLGGPSTTGTIASRADVHCYQVAAETADQLVFGVRNAKGMVRTLVLDADGAQVGCGVVADTCSVAGKARYQVLVFGDQLVRDDRYHLDAWKMWTAGGPAKECTAVPSSAYGFGPYTGTLTTTDAPVCLLTTARQGRDLRLELTNPVTPTDGFGLATRLFAVTASAGLQQCTTGTAGSFSCPSGRAPVEQTAFLLTAGDRAPHPYRWTATCATPLCGDSTFAVTAVAPTALTAGATRSITVRGTSLHLRDTVTVTPAGKGPITATVKTVSADRTALTAEVDLTSAAAGPATIEVRSFAAGIETAKLAGALQVVAPVLRATTAPTIAGKPVVGGTVTAGTGTWTPAATSYAYQWLAGGVAINGATARSYVIPAALVGKRLTVRVTGKRAGATSATATSAPSAAVGKGPAAKATSKPAIRGTAKVGRKVTAAVGNWRPKPTAFRYEWRLNGAVVRGAGGSSLKLTAAMRGKRLTVTVIAVRPGHADGKAQSAAVVVRR